MWKCVSAFVCGALQHCLLAKYLRRVIGALESVCLLLQSHYILFDKMPEHRGNNRLFTVTKSGKLSSLTRNLFINVKISAKVRWSFTALVIVIITVVIRQSASVKALNISSGTRKGPVQAFGFQWRLNIFHKMITSTFQHVLLWAYSRSLYCWEQCVLPT